MNEADLKKRLQTLSAQGNAKACAELVSTAVKDGVTHDPRVLYFGADAAYQANMDDACVQLLVSLAGVKELDADQTTMLAHARERLGQRAAAVETYEAALALNPNSVVARYNLGTLCLRRNDWGKAVDHLTAACDLSPGLEVAEQNLIRALMGAENFTACFERIKHCLALTEDQEPYLALKAEALLRDGRFQEGEDLYRHLADQVGDSIDYRKGLLSALMYANKFEEAGRTLNDLREDGLEGFELKSLKASLLLERGDAEDAFRLLEELVSANPRERMTFVNLVDACIQTGRTDLGIAYCDDRLAHIAGDPEAFAYRGICYLAQERYHDFQATQPDKYAVRFTLPCPDGYADIAAFNDAVRSHIQQHPTLVHAPTVHSTYGGNQTGSLLSTPMGPIEDFINALGPIKDAYRAQFEADGHPMFERWSDDYGVAIWAVELTSGGHQEAHIHPSGFLSGVYYPKLPKTIRGSNDQAGHIQFFQPPPQFKVNAEPVLVDLEPIEGDLFLFPPGYFHQTVPFEDDEPRISMAFDFFARS